MATVSDSVTEIAKGIKSVIDRKTIEYQSEYRINTKGADASFSVRVTRFRGDGATRVLTFILVYNTLLVLSAIGYFESLVVSLQQTDGCF